MKSVRSRQNYYGSSSKFLPLEIVWTWFSVSSSNYILLFCGLLLWRSGWRNQESTENIRHYWKIWIERYQDDLDWWITRWLVITRRGERANNRRRKRRKWREGVWHLLPSERELAIKWRGKKHFTLWTIEYDWQRAEPTKSEQKTSKRLSELEARVRGLSNIPWNT